MESAISKHSSQSLIPFCFVEFSTIQNNREIFNINDFFISQISINSHHVINF